MTTTRPSRRLSGRGRKVFLAVHLLAAAAWFGIDLAVGVLVITAAVTDSPQTAGAALQAVGIFAVWPMFTTSVLCLASGAVLGLSSKYGLVRYWWVAVKLAINVVFAVLIIAGLRPGINEAADAGARMTAGDTTAAIPPTLFFPIVLGPSLLLTAYLLSVFKPWGRLQQRAPAARELATSRR
ncbi:hypothetical protein SAMN05421805_1011046 [Saccharopolyspora antimicrobica]|uniref:DUF2269 domain-containing protein n=1 Tax=Saccharopolyspora antimicrobica TaxID=455193 RepID=A0A1I4SLN8_9PSEU|nr:hypothetical protein [Saccharopolyspora antimicrobica]RKT87792.1 hypothetical protein ATL45_6213 [Saccharopolyspora antimicrobica]SFM65334.1 hypothetical protein SAMN05421805_1011046 [Saccharopolyspora antimicrobica]